MRRICEVMVLLCLSPLLGIGWLAGVAWKGLECGFWFGCRFIDEATS
jgi:hypothetical protein